MSDMNGICARITDSWRLDGKPNLLQTGNLRPTGRLLRRGAMS